MAKRNQTRYRCVDCDDAVFISSIILNRRNGDRCMNCGGQIQPDSNGADERLRVGADHGNEVGRSGIQSYKNQRGVLRK